MEVHFTQFMRPDGRRKAHVIDRPDDIGLAAQELIDAGCHLDIEALRTGHISMSVEREDDEGETDVLSNRVCGNGPPVPVNVDEMIREAHAKLMED